MAWTYEDAKRVEEEALRRAGSLEATGKTEHELATERAAKICEEMARVSGERADRHPGSARIFGEYKAIQAALQDAAASIRGEG